MIAYDNVIFFIFCAYKKSYFSMVRVLISGAKRRAVQEGNEASVFLGKQSILIRSIFKLEYFRLKSYIPKFVRRVIGALLVNDLLIAFARLVQKIFWICAGIRIYVVVLITIQKIVTNVL